MKYCEEMVQDIEKGLKSGLSKKSVCDCVGISSETFYKWVKEKSDFSDRIKRAVSDGKQDLINRIYEHGRYHWQAYAWLLERCHPDEFAQKTKIDMTDTTPDEKKITKKIDQEYEKACKQVSRLALSEGTVNSDHN